MLAAVGCGDREPAPQPPPAPPETRTEAETGGETSRLWGRAGEAWRPDGRLPDFSHAGYRTGAEEIPEVPVRVNVRDFGAVGDGVSDDSRAFLAALAAVENGALYIPAGRYRLTEVLQIEKSNVVLRGAGPGETVLFFPESLFEVEGDGIFGGTYGWTWGGAFLRALEVTEFPEPLTTIRAPARRGDTRLELASTAGIEAGDWLRLVQYESDGSLALHLHGGHVFQGRCMVDTPDHRSMDWAFRVAAVDDAGIELDRTLRIDVRPEWRAAVLPFIPIVEEVGIEGLTVEFPESPVPSHHSELGYNAISLRGVSDSWVRDVEIVNADNALLFWYVRYSTASGIKLAGRSGHYGLYFGGAQDSLITDFEITNASEHDLSVAVLANGNVFSRGRGKEINFDHHRLAPYENLFSDIDVGDSWQRARLWRSSDTLSGHYSAARETFWNIRPRIKAGILPAWPELNVIGPIRGRRNPRAEKLDAWLEPLNPIAPPDLHAAQRAWRRASRAAPEEEPR